MSPLDKLHDRAMEAAFLADLQRRRGNEEQAAKLFDEALAFELEAIAAMTTPVEPTWSILHRSAGWLALDCNQPRQAEQLAAKALASEPPPKIAEELRDLLEQINFQRHLELKGVTLQQDEIQMSLSGKAVGLGIVNSDEFFNRVNDSSRIIHRIIERRKNKPFRERGRLEKDIKENYQVFVSVPRAASFSVTLKLGHASQLVLPGIMDTAAVVDEFMSLMELVSNSRLADIQEQISDPAYLRNFLGLTKKIAPDGERIRQVGFTVLRSGIERSVEITKPASEISLGLVEEPSSAETEPVELQGTLRYADATHHKGNRIKIVDAEQKPHMVMVPEGMMNDIVRPMWDLVVTIKGVRIGKSIELREICEAPEDER